MIDIPDENTLTVSAILLADPFRRSLLEIVASLALPDCWIAAGFVRNAIWDHLHHRSLSAPLGDVDVIWFDRARANPSTDRDYEMVLRRLAPSITWSVKNQARMHERNADPPYLSATDAMRYWPETATAVAARLHGSDDCKIAAPLGLDDLIAMILRPTSRFKCDKRSIYEGRLLSKAWDATWPLVRRVDE